MAKKRFRYEILRQVDVVAEDEQEAFEQLKEQHQYCYPDVAGEKCKSCYYIGESERIKKW